MKKLYSLIFIALPFCALAQPTITQADEPVIDLYVGTVIDNGYVGAIPPGGANQTWNYTNLQAVDSGGVHFLDVEGTPYQTTFPNANLATYDAVKNEWAYFHTSASGVYVSGIDSAGLNLVFNPEWLYMPVPFTYNNTFSSTARAQVDTSFDTLSFTVPVKIIHTVFSDFLADGYGTLQLPLVSYPNVLRIKNKEVSTDSILYYNPFTFQWTLYNTPIPSQSHNYRWVRSNGPDAFLLEIRADSAGTTATRSEYQWISVISVPELNKETVRVTSYPNPATNAVNIDFEKAATGTIVVYNSLGEVVKASSLNNISRYTMYVNSLADGLYHFALNSSDNKIREGSFTVSH